MATLEAARKRQQGTAAKLADAEAALSRAHEAEAQAKAALKALEDAQAKAAEGLADRLRAWISNGSTGDRPRARVLSVEEVRQRQAAETDLAAAQAIITVLTEERDRAQSMDTGARHAVREAVRSILRLDAIEIARRITELENEAGELWHQLHALSLTQLDGIPIKGHPAIADCIASPPRKANRTDMHPTRVTERTAAAVKAVKERYAGLVNGEASEGEAEPCQQPSQAA